MQIHIMSGPSGSGKSTEAARIKASYRSGEAIILSADDFFIEDGVYRFHWSGLRYAHEWCQSEYHKAMESGKYAGIIVDNTNTSVWQITPYYEPAAAKGHFVELVTVLCDPSVGAIRNVHGVDLGTVVRQERDIRNRVIPNGWKLSQRAINTNPPGAQLRAAHPSARKIDLSAG